jgi:hypothetical protein
MPSGFLILPDGRCFSIRWAAHDDVLRAVANQLADSPELQNWLRQQLPGPEDIQEVGIGMWIRAADNAHIERHIDLRLMTAENQRLFCQAAKRAAKAAHAEDWLPAALDELVDMIVRWERGELPLSKSHSRVVPPLEGERIGPGWGSAGSLNQ